MTVPIALGSAKMKATHFLKLGEDPEGVRLELCNGDIFVSPAANPDHAYIVTVLTQLLSNHIRPRKLGRLYGDIDVLFGPYNVRRPDLAFVAQARLAIVQKDGIHGPPDLCIEIISPSSATLDRVEKFALYESHAVPNYWLVDPHARSLEAFILKDGHYNLAQEGRNADTLHLPPFNDLALPLGEIWP